MYDLYLTHLISEVELQKVKDLVDMKFISEEEYNRRIREILGDGQLAKEF